MKQIVIVKTGDTFPAISSGLKDFEDWIAAGLEVSRHLISVVDVPGGAPLPDPEQCIGAVIAGSHAMVTQDLPWSLAIEKWIPGLVNDQIPVLGICYGHQLLARALGGSVAWHPGGLEIGTVNIDCMTTSYLDPLFRGLPERFKVHVCHSQTVTQLPRKAVLIASNAHEPHHAYRIGGAAWGVQFHPEYDSIIMNAYIDNMADAVASTGRTVAQVKAGVQETPLAAKILKRFGKLVCG